jgi:hypothetical protein
MIMSSVHSNSLSTEQSSTGLPSTGLNNRRQRILAYLLVAVTCLLAYRLIHFSPIRAYENLDPRGSSLIAQAILQHQTIRVDGYTLPPQNWLFENRNGHVYTTYPLGTPLFIVPFVALELARGHDMQRIEDDNKLQRRLASYTVIIFALLAFGILRVFLPPLLSACLLPIWIFGTGILSTMGAALWSINLVVVWEMVTLLILVRYFSGLSQRLRPVLLGFSLFAAYLCRPTAAMLAALVFILLWRESPRAFLTALGVFVLGFIGLVAFSIHEFGTWLPTYYLTFTCALSGYSWKRLFTAFYGALFGPARGLFVYQPVFFLIVIGCVYYYRRLFRMPLFWLVVAWIGLEILAVVRFPDWWGGGSFGSRLMVGSFPGWVVLTGLVLREFRFSGRRAFYVGLACGLLSGIGIFVHSFQALYNDSTWDWNATPGSIGADPKNMLDWRHPQFLASPRAVQQLQNRP